MAAPALVHSIFGASGAHRWVPCPGSIQAIQRFYKEHPDHNPENLAADEGTLAHELSDVLINNPTWPLEDVNADWVIDIVKESHVWKPEFEFQFDFLDMLDICLRYRDYAQALAEDALESGDDIVVYSETQVAMPRIHDNSFGTNDYAVVNLTKRHVDILDLKYGRGVFVDVNENMQVLSYAEGIRNQIKQDHGVNIETYRGHIYQPRHNDGENIASWEFDKKRVNKFITIAADAAAKAELPDPPLNPGDKQCSFCEAKGDCKALAAQMTERLQAEFPDIDESVASYSANVEGMSDEELSVWLDRAKPIIDWMEAIKKTAYARATNGRPIPNFKLAVGRNSYRGDAEALEFMLGDDAFEEPKLKSQSSLRKAVGSKKFTELYADYYETIEGKPTLVPATSNAQEWVPEQAFKDALDEMDEADL